MEHPKICEVTEIGLTLNKYHLELPLRSVNGRERYHGGSPREKFEFPAAFGRKKGKNEFHTEKIFSGVGKMTNENCHYRVSSPHPFQKSKTLSFLVNIRVDV